MTEPGSTTPTPSEESRPIDSGRFVPPSDASNAALVLNLLLALALLYLFLVGVNSLSGGIKLLGKGAMDAYLGEDMNPMLGLLAGILATTLVQSSSVTTSIIVGLVASGQVPVSSAVPMIMGANIGTTVTNTIASLAHGTRSGEFKRAFAAATCHDFFNFLAVVTMLPVELITRAISGKGILERIALSVAEVVTDTSGAKYKSPLKAAFKAGAKLLKSLAEAITDNEQAIAILWSVTGVVVIFIGLTGIVKVMKGVVLKRLERYVNKFLGAGGPIGIVVGIVLTVMVQSSSITTSVLVPLAGAGLMTVRQVYPVTLGANLGTTITALLASMVVEGDAAVAARQIALVHLFFNLSGMAVWYFPPMTRNIAPRLAERFSEYAAKSRGYAVAYVAAVFYGLPALIFFASR